MMDVVCKHCGHEGENIASERCECAVVMLVDGVELKEWYKTSSEARERYERIKRIL